MDQNVIAIFWLIIASVSLFATIFGIRYLRNRENMAMIERGMNPREETETSRPKPFSSLRIGLPLAGAGLGLFIASAIDYYVPPGHDIPGIYFGLIATLGGIGFIASYRIEMKWWREQKENKES